ncbi:MAG: ATP-dependent DNA ligase [Actinomycetota bacterium]
MSTATDNRPIEPTLSDFAGVADAIAAAPGKLEKTRLLAEFLSGLSDEDLYWAAVYFTGAAFPRGSGKVVQVGFAALQAATLAVTGVDEAAFHAEYLRWSDVGDTVGNLYGDSRASHGLSLSGLAHRFELLAATPAGAAKSVVLTELFHQLSGAEARYVAKVLTGDLRIGLKEGLVEDAVAAAADEKPAAVRKAHQLIGDVGKLAVAARHHRLEALQARLFSPLKPMLATAESATEVIVQRVGAELWIEDKYDGIRAQAHHSNGRVALYSRDLKEISEQFPDAIAALEQLPGDLILDGELLAHRNGTALPFFELQKRLGRKSPGKAILASAPVAFFAFDLLYQGGEPLLNRPFRERRARLETLPQTPGFYVSPLRRRGIEHLDDEFTLAKSRANEGLMIKDPESLYVPGRRGMSWVKVKKALDPLDVVVTGVEYGHGRRREVLSDYTFAVRNEETAELVNIGKAYSGLTDAEIAELTEYFKQNTLQSFGRFQVVRPELVIEVAFEAIQESPRHKSGFALRFPRILRFRTDKTAADINTLTDVRARYQQYRAVYEQEPE